MWYYFDFKVIDHESDCNSPTETTIIFGNSRDEAVDAFVEMMKGEAYELISVRV